LTSRGSSRYEKSWGSGKSYWDAGTAAKNNKVENHKAPNQTINPSPPAPRSRKNSVSQRRKGKPLRSTEYPKPMSMLFSFLGREKEGESQKKRHSGGKREGWKKGRKARRRGGGWQILSDLSLRHLNAWTDRIANTTWGHQGERT